MNKEKLIGALDGILKSVEEIKNSLNDTEFNNTEASLQKVSADEKPTEPSFTELLANRLAWSYSTMHPEYKVDNQFKNLGDMVKGPKISYVLNWIKKKKIDGLENFFNLPLESQRHELQIAMCNYEDKIKEVFTKRFAQ